MCKFLVVEGDSSYPPPLGKTMCTNTHLGVTYLLNQKKIKNKKILRNRTQILYKIKKFLTCASDDTFSEVATLWRR